MTVGAEVATGQKIAEANGVVSVPLHASISGKVVAIEPRPTSADNWYQQLLLKVMALIV